VFRVLSKTTLFIANLPFSVDDAGLAKIFEGFKCTAHVVKTRSGRSRGYGFVTFETEEDQQKALKALDGKEVAGANGNNRVISVKIALSDPRRTHSTSLLSFLSFSSFRDVQSFICFVWL
jgi:RNA recognition motif-containing protein